MISSAIWNKQARVIFFKRRTKLHEPLGRVLISSKLHEKNHVLLINNIPYMKKIEMVKQRPRTCITQSWENCAIQGSYLVGYINATILALFSIFESPIIHFVCPPPPQILHKPLFSNALGNMQCPQEHLKTIVYAKFGGQTKCIMGNSKIDNCTIPTFCTLFGIN